MPINVYINEKIKRLTLVFSIKSKIVGTQYPYMKKMFDLENNEYTSYCLIQRSTVCSIT